MPKDPAAPLHVSIIQLLATPEKYRKKQVQVFGFLHQEFEDSGLYLSKEAADYLDATNALWVSGVNNARLSAWHASQKVNLRYFHGKHVWVIGTFNPDHHGHFSSYAAGIEALSINECAQAYDGAKELDPFPKPKITKSSGR